MSKACFNSSVPGPDTEQRRLAAIMFTDMVGYSALAQRDEAMALELLERAAENRDDPPVWLAVDPYWKDLRPHLRVQAILRKMNLVK
jgi:hypothetical protein